MNVLQGKEKEEAEKYMQFAIDMAKKSLCKRSKCGTAIVSDGEVIGSGYNAPALDREDNRMCDHDTCCIHSEWRAMIDMLKNNKNKIKNSKLYFARVDFENNFKFSGKPTCTVCSRLALDIGIDKFLLWTKEGIIEYDTHEYNIISCENKR